ncbi:zinc transport system ATP-binding protein [Thioalkalivibrio sp. ALE21]|uniref:ATP-binding cassette domain-containing protein n=1 Tax=Thioalkalivibrio sp. ALE21 TaxID=1158175 RepID=UPI000D87BE7B|nr:ATP-binding cassette domain-containing protein [Thioalkalivibrio sp. ALE21]PYG02505.1 zinc transport system ATP-binding protein [Thioalkalivibrio sp. ALE21]
MLYNTIMFASVHNWLRGHRAGRHPRPRPERGSGPLVAAREVTVERGGRTILDRVSMAVHAGEAAMIIGPNGAGKTSLLRVLMGLWQPDGGHVERVADLRVGYMPQRLQIEPVLPLSVYRFLRMRQRLPRRELLARLERVGVGHLIDSPIQSLSGGETQRVLLARALLGEPDLLVLDEPAQGVDVVGQGDVFVMLDDIRRESGCGVLIVSHDLHFVMAGAETVICLNQHVCCTGNPEEVSQHPEYRRLFPSVDLRGLAVYTHNHNHVHGLHGEVRPLDGAPEDSAGACDDPKHGPGCRH